MLADALQCLHCPVCGAKLVLSGSRVVCERAHSFDIAREGYVNLSSTRPSGLRGDTRAMVAARQAFLSAGHFSRLADLVAELSARFAPAASAGCVLDVGGGTGYYLERVLDSLTSSQGIVLDQSKAAARVAARAHPRMSAIVADAWGSLPLGDDAAILVLNVFAPRNPAEFARVLRREGALIVVTPLPEHLAELRGALGLMDVDADKEQRLIAQLTPYFEERESATCSETLLLDKQAVEQVVMMGPNAWHAEETSALSAMDDLALPFAVRAAFRVSVWQTARR